MEIRTTVKHLLHEAHREGMREVERYSAETPDHQLATSHQALDFGEVENRLLGIDLEYRAYFYVFGAIHGFYQTVRGRR